MAATLIWDSAAAVNGYIRETNLVTSNAIEGVMCCDSIDVSNYDNENYRDDFFSTVSSVGNLQVQFPGLTGGDTGISVLELTEPETPTFTEGLLSPETGSSKIISGTDALMHVPPRHELKKRTMLRFWSGAWDAGTTTGTGNLLAMVWADQFISFTPANPSFMA